MSDLRWGAGHGKGARGKKVAALVAAVLVVALGVTLGVIFSAGHGSRGFAAASGGQLSEGASGATTDKAPLTVESVTPAAGATGVPGNAPVVVHLSSSLDKSSPLPTLSPNVTGAWTRPGSGVLEFQPSTVFVPGSSVSLDIPSGPGGLRATNGATLASAPTDSWQVGQGSVLGLQELLAQLNYLPLTFTPANPAAASPAQAGAAAFDPPQGSFSWRWMPPPTLAALWTPGQSTVMVKGAIMAFESHEGLPTDGSPGPAVWTKLLQAAGGPGPAANTSGYTYALVTEQQPETLTVWHDGNVVEQTPANTGIPSDPTVDGDFPVYEHLQSQVMSGTNPDGSHYADPVQWVAYFNGGDAVHYIDRSSFGYPQSLGCVEVPYSAGQTAWPYLQLGSVVSVR